MNYYDDEQLKDQKLMAKEQVNKRKMNRTENASGFHLTCKAGICFGNFNYNKQGKR